MPREHVLQALLEQHGERFFEPVEEQHRRRVGEVAGGVGLDHFAQVEEGAGALRLLARGEGTRAGAQDPDPGGQHQPLLGAGHCEVHCPFIHAEVEARDPAHAIHVQQRRVLGGVHGTAHRAHVARDAGGRLVVHDQDALDLVRGVAAQDIPDLVYGRPFSQLDVQHVHLNAMLLGELDPEVSKLAVAGGEQAVAGRQGVGEGRLPGPRAARREDERLTGGGFEESFQVAEKAGRQLGERRGAVVLHGAVHGAEDPVRDVGGPGDEEEVAAGHSVALRESGAESSESGRRRSPAGYIGATRGPPASP